MTSSATGNAPPVSCGSEVGSLFPDAMQQQMREFSRQDQGLGESSDLYQNNSTSVNAPGFETGLRGTDSLICVGL